MGNLETEGLRTNLLGTLGQGGGYSVGTNTKMVFKTWIKVKD